MTATHNPQPATLLPPPDEPAALRRLARTLLEQAPEEGLPLIVAGEWMADPLWERWGEALERRGMGREAFGRIVAEYGNELRLWVVGERPWEQYVSGLAGRVARRLPSFAESVESSLWRDALTRVGIRAGADLPFLTERLAEMHLLHDLSPANGHANGAVSATAVVWAGARPRDPECPSAEGHSLVSPAEALAEALGRFLLKDPAYPDTWVI